MHASSYGDLINISKVSLAEYRITRGDTVKLMLEGRAISSLRAVGTFLVHEKHRSALAEIIEKLNEYLSGDYRTGALGSVVAHLMRQLVVDDKLQAQAQANTPQQFAESSQIPGSFARTRMNVREESPQIVQEIVGDADILAMLSYALPAMLYEALRDEQPTA